MGSELHPGGGARGAASKSAALEQMTIGGPEYLDAIVAYELDVTVANRTRGHDFPEPLVAVYPYVSIPSFTASPKATPPEH